MDYFTDRENGKKPANLNEINVTVWNGIVAVFESFVSDNSFSKDFPVQCPDLQGVYTCDLTLLYDKLNAVISDIEIPVKRKERFVKDYGDFFNGIKEVETIVDTFETLDFIEFCFRHLYDAAPIGKLHDYFNHYHLSFKDTGISKLKFQAEINSLFERNGIAYYLDEHGKVNRILDKEFLQIIKRNFSTKDETLNSLLFEATQYILLPKITDRIRAVERLWDAFERAKTYYSGNKKVSVAQLINFVANGNALLETHINSESVALTEIGNKFQIRHFEKDKQPITDLSHIDYLFFRMFSLIDLFIKELEK
jgi:hypothetical protein